MRRYQRRLFSRLGWSLWLLSVQPSMLGSRVAAAILMEV